MYNFKDIEKKWQDKWYKGDYFKAVDFHPTKEKYYILYEFYNISGNLHMGHLKGTVPADALARYKRFNGFNVLFPIGGDAFGLPAENAAIKHGIKPALFVENGMKNVIEQSKALGLSFDFDRTINTSSPDYYKWTEWIFLKLFENDKAYKSNGVVNYCPNCKTVLSNEDSQGGECDRCHGKVVQENRSVWFLKMKEYSEKLLDNIDKIDMNENLKELQRNWIGKSTGCEVTFDIVDKDNNFITKKDIYTTCIETIYGITFMVMAPENNFIDNYKEYISNYDEVIEYRYKTSYRSEFERISDQKDKTGCILEGIYATNPLTGKNVPVYVSDFVLNNYGTGMVMAVPAHDERDYEFAKKYNIEIIKVIDGDITNKAYEKYDYIKANSVMVNSNEFTGIPVVEAKKMITDKIINMGIGKIKTNYKMQDWSFNRQRYWGEPFPIVYCDKCGIVPLKEEDLPILLPDTTDYKPNEDGSSPLSKIESWVNIKCPKCGGDAKRETDTMPNWAGSSWYWIRYMDPHNDKELVNYDKAKYWGSVDCYTGGTEHITRHVLYAFFWQNFLYDIGVVPVKDPFIRKMGSGLILDDTGHKMSKSSTNGVSPLEVIDKYGCDAARLHVHFLAGYEDNTIWTYDGINGITNFLNNVWNLKDMINGDDISREHIYEINNLIKKVSSDIEDLKLNTSIAALMSFIKKVKEDKFINKEELRIFLILLNPIAPHITSEIYEMVFNKDIIDEVWPTYDSNYLEKNIINLPIQINGKMKKTIEVDKDISENDLINKIKEVYPNLIQSNNYKVIYIPGKIINIIYV
jgi:leucyl-tRNA synthetase